MKCYVTFSIYPTPCIQFCASLPSSAYLWALQWCCKDVWWFVLWWDVWIHCMVALMLPTLLQPCYQWSFVQDVPAHQDSIGRVILDLTIFCLQHSTFILILASCDIWIVFFRTFGFFVFEIIIFEFSLYSSSWIMMASNPYVSPLNLLLTLIADAILADSPSHVSSSFTFGCHLWTLVRCLPQRSSLVVAFIVVIFVSQVWKLADC